MEVFKGKNLLITGGTGSFGRQVIETLIDTEIGSITIFSRDESKQETIRHLYNSDKLKFIIGDVRDKASVSEALENIDFVFHGGSGSTVEEIREGISYGVVKMNIDTDMQYAFMSGIRDYMKKNEAYLQSQIGNPDGDDSPNKKYYDPRVWLRSGEVTFVERLKKAFEDLNNVNTL